MQASLCEHDDGDGGGGDDDNNNNNNKNNDADVDDDDDDDNYDNTSVRVQTACLSYPTSRIVQMGQAYMHT